MVPGVAATLLRNDFLTCDGANLVASLVSDVDGVRHLCAMLRLRLCGVGRLHDIDGVLRINDRNAIGLDRCSKLVIDLAGIFLRNALRRR